MTAARPTQALSLHAKDNLRYDLPAAIVVFLVALPLCMGIALASGAPILAGILTGVVGGLVVAPVGRSALAVSGPAAGLTVIVLHGIESLGYPAFLTAVALSGVIQVVLGFLGAGVIAYYIPNAVIRGMLSGIGVLLLLKQVPHAVGYDKDFEGDFSFVQADGHNTLSELLYAAKAMHPGAITISALGVAILFGWPRLARALPLMGKLPAPLVVAALGIAINQLFDAFLPHLSVDEHLLVGVPHLLGQSWSDFGLSEPSLSGLWRPEVWKTAAVIAAVASIETLLCIEAIDRQDPFHRRTSTSRELKAQGVGNLLCGICGGIPLTAVIVRGSANVQAGGRTWVSAFTHGLLLLASALLIPDVLNLIPLSALAAVLLHVGYKLIDVGALRKMWQQGPSRYLPTVITILGILLTDLLSGVLTGLAVGIFFVLREHARATWFVTEIVEGESSLGHTYDVKLAENVTFLNKAGLRRLLDNIPPHSVVNIDASGSRHIDHDAREILEEMVEVAPLRSLRIVVTGLGPERSQPLPQLSRRP